MSTDNWEQVADWRDSPFFVVMYEYIVKNASMPTDMGTLIAYVIVVLITWYALLMTARFLLWLIWPTIIITLAFFLFRFLRAFEHGDLVDISFQAITLIADTSMSCLAKLFDFLLSYLD